jgi:hypothetical protein
MIHYFFILSHIFAVLFFLPILFVSIPLHVIITFLRPKGPSILQQIKESRPHDVQMGHRNLTFNEGWAEILKFPMFYSQIFGFGILVVYYVWS